MTVADPLYSLRDVRRTYRTGGGSVNALGGVTFDLSAGELVAVEGPSGSGKSTLLQLLGALDNPTSGSLLLDGRELSGLSEGNRTRVRSKDVGFVFQSFNLIPTLTAAENITLPLDLAGRKPDQDWVDHAVSTVGLGDRLTHRPSELSGGQQQRVAVGRALASQPAIIFADEPTGNLDSRASAEILGFMQRAVSDLGQTIVMVTHDPTSAAYASRVVFLADGRIVDEQQDPTSEQILDRMKAFGDD
jgi:putative ABC transport system ATP-binding protein